MKFLYLSLALALAALPTSAGPREASACREGGLPPVFEGLAFAGDGDTIYGVGQTAAIRLWGMDTPELRSGGKTETTSGMRARAYVADLLAEAGHRVSCIPLQRDRYCRVVSTCLTAHGKDIVLETLRAGFAYGFFLSAATRIGSPRALPTPRPRGRPGAGAEGSGRFGWASPCAREPRPGIGPLNPAPI